MNNNGTPPSLEAQYILLKEIKADIQEIKDCYVTQKEFWPVRTIAYGLMGTIGLAVIGALLALIIKSA
jgi:drug/metabolite transporter superfamily protein YnfA